MYFLFILYFFALPFPTLSFIGSGGLGEEQQIFFCYSLNLFIKSNPSAIYNFLIKKKSWPFFQRFKKHTSLDHYKKSSSPEEKNFLKFRNKWNARSGIYKLTFLPCKLFTYYGSSKNLSLRLKYHSYNTSKENTFLALFIKTFGWDCFAVTVVE